MAKKTDISNSHSFVLYNHGTNKCVTIQKFKQSYSLRNPINSKWQPILTSCNSETKLQLWNWDKMDHLIHATTGTYLSIGENSINSLSMTWLCAAGYHIVQPHSQYCLTADITRNQDPLQERLDEALLTNSLNRENDFLKLARCDNLNKYQKFSIYNNDQFGNLCDSFPTHKLTMCYTERIKDNDGWMRCLRLGYYISDLNQKSEQTTKITSLQCCATQYAFKDESTYSLGNCYHRNWWSSNAVTKFHCEKGEYLHGIRLLDSEVTLVECCQIIKKDYQCQSIFSSHGCGNKGFISGYYFDSSTCFYKNCKKEFKCCA